MSKVKRTYTCQYSEIDVIETGKKIKDSLIKKHIPVNELANSIGVSGQSVYKWINGQSMPTLENMFQISQILSVPIDKLIVGKSKIEYTVPELYVRDEMDSQAIILR